MCAVDRIVRTAKLLEHLGDLVVAPGKLLQELDISRTVACNCGQECARLFQRRQCFTLVARIDR